MTEATKMLKILRLNTFIQIEQGKLSINRGGKEYPIDCVDLEGNAACSVLGITPFPLTDDEIDLLFGRTFSEKTFGKKAPRENPFYVEVPGSENAV